MLRGGGREIGGCLVGQWASSAFRSEQIGPDIIEMHALLEFHSFQGGSLSMICQSHALKPF